MEKNAGSVDLRIVGGKDARPTKWPFILSLHKNGMFKCGATIIDENWILTAAHCVQKFDEDHGHFQVKSCMFSVYYIRFNETLRNVEKSR